jgi:hypothetical protein
MRPCLSEPAESSTYLKNLSVWDPVWYDVCSHVYVCVSHEGFTIKILHKILTSPMLVMHIGLIHFIPFYLVDLSDYQLWNMYFVPQTELYSWKDTTDETKHTILFWIAVLSRRKAVPKLIYMFH